MAKPRKFRVSDADKAAVRQMRAEAQSQCRQREAEVRAALRGEPPHKEPQP